MYPQLKRNVPAAQYSRPRRMGPGFRRDDGKIAMKSPRAFSHVDTWVFDLDNTLYPHHVNLWQQVDARIGEFVGAS